MIEAKDAPKCRMWGYPVEEVRPTSELEHALIEALLEEVVDTQRELREDHRWLVSASYNGPATRNSLIQRAVPGYHDRPSLVIPVRWFVARHTACKRVCRGKLSVFYEQLAEIPYIWGEPGHHTRFGAAGDYAPVEYLPGEANAIQDWISAHV